MQQRFFAKQIDLKMSFSIKLNKLPELEYYRVRINKVVPGENKLQGVVQ